MLHLAMAVLASILGTTGGEAAKPFSYNDAYHKARKENKPLVVLVGADWCPACTTMKSQTMEPLKDSGQLQDVVYAQVDKDSEPELAEKLMQGNSLPQIVVFAEGNEGWKRYSLTGIQSKGRVRDLIRRASSVLTGRKG